MKKKQIFGVVVLLAATLSVFAQENVRHIRVHSNGSVVYDNTTAAVDSIKVNSSYTLQMMQGTQTWARSIDNIDSITFNYVSSGSASADTTPVTNDEGLSITWNNGGTPTIVNSYSNQGVSIIANGEHVTVTSTAAIKDLTYTLAGTSSNGSLTISSDSTLILFLDGLTLTNPSGAAIKMTSDKKVTLHLAAGSASTLADGSASTDKGALQTQGKFVIQGSGILNVSGYAKHGIQSSGSTTMLAGTVNVLTAVKDGMNIDNFKMEGGTVNVTSLGDGVDGDQGYIKITGGVLTINTSADDTKALGCDSTVTIAGGNVTITATGADAKGIRSKKNVQIDGGTLTMTMSGQQSKGIKAATNYSQTDGTVDITASGSLALIALGNGYDPSYCTGIKSDDEFNISGGTLKVTCPSSNLGGKAISTDGDLNIAGGTLTLTASGTNSTYTDSTGATNSYSTTCLKSNTSVNIYGGTITASAYGKAISCDGDVNISGGTLTLSTNGAGAVTAGSGTSATDGYASACINTDANCNITGGNISCTSTGKGGRGIKADARINIGEIGADDDLIHLYVTTSGAPVNASSSGGPGGGGMPGQPGGSSSDYWKGIAKGIKASDDIIINSGHVQAYCSQTSGDPTAEAIETKDTLVVNGGYVEANAYDDAINAASHIDINGGHIWAYARGNDGIDCNGNNIHVDNATVIAYGTECAFDDNGDNGGVHLYINNSTLVLIGGNMGAMEGTPSLTGQKYITLGSSSGGYPGGGGMGGSGALTTAKNGFCVKSNGTEMITFKMANVSGSGFESLGSAKAPAEEVESDNAAKRVSGLFVTTPQMTATSYTYWTSPTISGGSSWHGLYTGASVTTSGNGTSATGN